jgi:hypothetical protein
MGTQSNERSSTMLRKTLIAAAALAAGFVAVPARADNGHHHGHWKHHKHRYYSYPAPRVVVVPRPVVVAPAPVYYYERPAPVYYPAPSGVSIRFNFPL